MDTLWLLVVLSVLFPLTHLVLSSGPVRKGLVRVIGEWPFRGLYSLIALACLAGMIIVYRHGRHLGVQLWDLPRPVELVLALPLMLAALVLVVTAFAAPSPAGMAPVAVRARGVLRITRHPLSIGLACFGLAHLLANGTVGDVAFFGSFVVLGVVGSMHQDSRVPSRLGEQYTRFQSETSMVPFVAILRRRTRLVPAELPWAHIVVGIAAFVALLLVHGRLFGVAVLG